MRSDVKYVPRPGSRIALVLAALDGCVSLAASEITTLLAVSRTDASALLSPLSVRGLVCRRQRALDKVFVYRLSAAGKKCLVALRTPAAVSVATHVRVLRERDYAPLKQRTVRAIDCPTPVLPSFQWPPVAALKDELRQGFKS